MRNKKTVAQEVIDAIVGVSCTIPASQVARDLGVSLATVWRYRNKEHGTEWTTLCRCLRSEPSKALVKDIRNPYLSSRDVGAKHGVLALRVRRARVALNVPTNADVALPYRPAKAGKEIDPERIIAWQKTGTRPYVIRNTGLATYATACTIAFCRYSLGVSLDSKARAEIRGSSASAQELAVEYGVSASTIRGLR